MNRDELVNALERCNDWSEIINFKKYPIQDLSSPEAQKLIHSCRGEMKKLGACELPDFVTPKALDLLQKESVFLEKQAFYKRVFENPYLAPGDEALGKDHPRNMKEDTNVGAVAYDQFPDLALLKRIYEYQPMIQFIGAVLELPEIHRYGDPMGGLNLSVMNHGDYLRWHFDQTDFVTSLAIQAGESGGNFEYVPMIRDNKNENFEHVRSLLKGDRSRVVHLDNRPGTLVLFQGRYSIHRVTPVVGSRPRWIGLFGYDSKPGVMSTPHLREMRYGRQDALTERPQF